MIVAADKTVMLMIEHKHIFLDLIDIMDEGSAGEEVSTRLYESKVMKLLDSLGDSKSDRQKIEAAFDVRNLVRASLILHHDTKRGVIAFAPFLIELFRHFDRSRLRQLSSADLEALCDSFNDSLEKLRDLTVIEQGNDTFEDELKLLRERIRYAQGKIKENVDSLQGQTLRLAEIVEVMSLENLDEVKQARGALQAITRIYGRHVLPTLQFLNEREPLKKGLPALTALLRISEMFRDAKLPKLGQQVLYAVASIRSYRYDVEVISKSLQRYVHQNERQRREYDQVESVFNDLLVACRELHDGKLRGNLIPKDHEVLERFSTFKGMKRQRADSKIEWHNVDHWLHIQEHLRSSLDSLKNTQVTTTSVEPVGEDVLKARRALDVRRKLIGRLIDEWHVQVGPDAHASLHAHLAQQISDYEIADLVEGMSWLKHREDIVLTPRFQLGVIEDDRQKLTYYKLRIEEQGSETTA